MRVVVVGGGIAGLAAAHRLRELAGPELEIVVVEGSTRLGGKLHTGDLAGRLVETGAEMFLTFDGGVESQVVALARRVGLASELVAPAALPAAVATGGRLVSLPAGTLLGVPGEACDLGPLATPADTDHDLGQPVLGPGEDVAVGRLVRDRLGEEVLTRLVNPMLGGVYSGRADELSLAATMPGLHLAAQHQPTLRGAVTAALRAAPRPPGVAVFSTVRSGMSNLVRAVANAAEIIVRCGKPVRQLTRTAAGWQVVLGATRNPTAIDADAVVLAVPATPAARLLSGVDSEVADVMSTLDYASVALVSLALPPATELPELTGLLVPEGEGFEMKAATFVTTKWPHLAGAVEPVIVRASYGRFGEEQGLQRADAELIDLARAELETLLARKIPPPLAGRVYRWGGALPQYAVGHVDRIGRIRTALPATLSLVGAAVDGVGIAACVRSGRAGAESVWSPLAPT